MKSAYQTIRKPVITEKGLGVKETQGTLVFQVAAKATKTEIKAKVLREALNKLKVDGTALVVESAKENRNLDLSARNLEGVELVRGPEVHPYHLLKYQQAVFAKTALEKLQNALKASAPKGRRRGAEVAQ